MLAYVLVINSFVADVYMNDIANMICQLQCVYLKELFISQQHGQNCRHLC